MRKSNLLKWSALLALLSIAGVVVFLVDWMVSERNAPGTIAPRGGEALSLQPTQSIHYRQHDPEWGNDEIGGSGERLRSVGCTLCSVAMAVSYLGHEVTPPVLNQKLIENSGYTERGWMIWSSVTPATEGKFSVNVFGKPSHAMMDASLKRGEIPIVKFFLPGSIPHWVAVVGKQGEEYLALDPALGGPDVVRLSTRAQSIHSLRVVRRK